MTFAMEPRRPGRRPARGAWTGAIRSTVLFLIILLLKNSIPIAAQTVAERQLAAPQRTVIAQGKLLPAGGIIEISLPPGEVVEAILVAPGEAITAGQKLIALRGEEARRLQLQALEEAIGAAEEARRQAQITAANQLTAARLELQRQQELLAGLSAREQLIALGQQRLDTARRALAELKKLTADPSLRAFVDQSEILQQEMLVQQAEADALKSQLDYDDAVRAAKLGIAAATAQVEAAERMVELSDSEAAIRRLKAERDAAEAAYRAALVTSPIDGTVLAVDVQVGEAGTGAPALALANLENMVCELEVNTIDAAVVQPGQTAILHSNALRDQPLRGTVVTKLPLVGVPLLKPFDPRARTDFRAVKTIVELDTESSRRAAQWLQLQVEATITIEGTSTHSAP
ncbi:MAG: hypothetical protein KatS3mg111_1884 [Pirellulaceae bacterium]|nr:MAG: hypothetical protein KatS3mg111_1884 [Pirellulaceae bacterium]